MRLLSLFEQKYLPTRLIGSSWRTAAKYRSVISVYSTHLGRPAILSDLTDESVAAFAMRRLEAKTAPATVNADLRHLRAVWEFACRKGLVALRPDFNFVREPVKLPKAWSVDDVSALLKSCGQETGLVGPLAAADFWRALVLFLYDVGCRKSVALNLPLENIDLKQRHVLLPAEEQKQRADQLLMFSKQCRQMLTVIITPHRELLFPWPYDRYRTTTWTCFNRHFKRIIRRAGLDTEHWLCHRMRKTRATLGERLEPGSATADLGHSSPAVTKRYIDVGMCKQVSGRVVDRLPRPRMN